MIYIQLFIVAFDSGQQETMFRQSKYSLQ